MIQRVRPRLVTFDVTGTLLLTKLEEYYGEIGRQYGLKVDSHRLARSFKSNFVSLATEHPIYGRHTGLGWENWWRTIVHRVFKDQHPSASKDTLNKIAENLINCYSTAQCWQIYPGAVELLDFLRKKNVILGVISNFDQRLEFILKDTQIREYFVFVLTSYNFGVEKPNLAIFEEAMKLVKRYQGENILLQEATHIGDSIDNDYLGAKNAGWNGLLIKHDGENDEINKTEVPKEHTFENLKRLREYFEKIFETNRVTSE